MAYEIVGIYAGFFKINPWRTCAARVTVVHVVCESLSQSVPRHLTSGAINRYTNNTTYSASGIGRIKGGVFSETAAFEIYGVKHERRSQCESTKSANPQQRRACSLEKGSMSKQS